MRVFVYPAKTIFGVRERAVPPKASRSLFGLDVTMAIDPRLSVNSQRQQDLEKAAGVGA